MLEITLELLKYSFHKEKLISVFSIANYHKLSRDQLHKPAEPEWNGNEELKENTEKIQKKTQKSKLESGGSLPADGKQMTQFIF